jgi:hypothetical protein
VYACMCVSSDGCSRVDSIVLHQSTEVRGEERWCAFAAVFFPCSFFYLFGGRVVLLLVLYFIDGCCCWRNCLPFSHILSRQSSLGTNNAKEKKGYVEGRPRQYPTIRSALLSYTKRCWCFRKCVSV